MTNNERTYVLFLYNYWSEVLSLFWRLNVEDHVSLAEVLVTEAWKRLERQVLPCCALWKVKVASMICFMWDYSRILKEYLCLKHSMSYLNICCVFEGFENYAYRLWYTNAWEIQILHQQGPTFEILKCIVFVDLCVWSKLQVFIFTILSQCLLSRS